MAKPKYKKHYVVGGSARSGTSWLAELIGLNFRYRLLFEPEHEFNTKNGYLLFDQLINEENVSVSQRKYFEQIFKNKVDCDWIAQLSNRRFKMHLWPLIPKKYVIKFVRCNLSLPYLSRSYGIPVFYIRRDPLEVIASQLRVGFPWLYDLKAFREQELLSALLKNHYGFIWEHAEAYNKTQVLALRWCIENQLLIDGHLGASNVVFLNHNVLRDDLAEFKALAKQHRFGLLNSIDELYFAPSSKTHPQSSVKTRQNHNSKLSSIGFREVGAIFEQFGVKGTTSSSFENINTWS